MKVQITVGNQSFVVDDGKQVAVIQKIIDAYGSKASANAATEVYVRGPRVHVVKGATFGKPIVSGHSHPLFKLPLRAKFARKAKVAGKGRKKIDASLGDSEEKKFYSIAISKLVKSDETTAGLMKGAIAKAKARREAEAKQN